MFDLWPTGTEQAVEYVEHLQTRLWDQGDHSMDDDLTSLLAMMESPLFRQILNLQESLQELKQVCLILDQKKRVAGGHKLWDCLLFGVKVAWGFFFIYKRISSHHCCN